jgi:Cu-Zn family superoxide dismutase
MLLKEGEFSVIKSSAFFVGILLLSSLTALAQTDGQKAHAEFHNAQGKAVGTATLTEGDGGVRIVANFRNLPKGQHAFHIHAVGTCTPPDFETAGDHFNPYGKQHGLQDSDGAHAGDLTNIAVEPDGTASVSTVAPHVTLDSGKNSLLQGQGTALVIHAKADDYKTDPSGNSGDRIACGVITK